LMVIIRVSVFANAGLISTANAANPTRDFNPFFNMSLFSFGFWERKFKHSLRAKEKLTGLWVGDSLAETH
jgi:hypothetical protein